MKSRATISMVKENPNKTAPTLDYYSSGFDPLARMKDTGSGSGSPSNPIKFYRNGKKGNRFEAIIKPKGVGVDFVGTNYRGEGATPGMNNFALGVLDKITGTLTITRINTDKVLRLEPVVRASHKEPGTPTPAKNENASAVQDDTRDRKNSLINLYGTKTEVFKAKRAIEVRRHEDDGSELEVRRAIENMSKSIDKEAIVSWSCNAVETPGPSDIPPYDLSATLPEKAYLLDKIILRGEWAYVRDILDLLHSGKQIKAHVYPSFVCNRFCKLELTKDEAEKERLACIMSYISYLIDFKNRYSLGGSSSSSSKHHHHQRFIPNILLMKFNKMFLDAEKNRLADEKIGSLISYVLVLTLFVDEFQTDFTDIAKDLKIGILKVRSHLLNLGCKHQRNGVSVAHLPVPLTFPPPPNKKRRRQ